MPPASCFSSSRAASSVSTSGVFGRSRSSGVIVALVQLPCRSGRPSAVRGIVAGSRCGLVPLSRRADPQEPRRLGANGVEAEQRRAVSVRPTILI